MTWYKACESDRQEGKLPELKFDLFDPFASETPQHCQRK